MHQKRLAVLKKMNLHPGFTATKAGLVISLEQPGLAASSGGYIKCKCHGIGVIEAKCCWSHRNEKISDIIDSRNDFYLLHNTKDPEYYFTLKTNHPYYYQVQQQMMVTNSYFCIFMVYTDVDLGKAMISRDEVVCHEIKEKTSLFFSTVLLPQMVAEWFVNTDYVPSVTNAVQVLDDDCVDVAEEHQVEILSHCNSAPSTESNFQPSTSNNSSLYTCCTEVHENGAVVTCSNVDCLVGTYHKLCVKPPRKRFGPTWVCTSCSTLLKKW